MILFRSARNSDLAAIHQLAENSGVGMTTLPNDAEVLKKRLAWSTSSFNKAVESPSNEYYLFVLEDTVTAQIVGTSAIESATGYDTPFYSYKLSKRTRICHDLAIRTNYDILSLVNDNQGHSEICTLFLDPNYRINNNGILLSRARFLFMAHYPDRFAPIVIADMRGVSDDEGRSPFWDNIGSHFFQMSYTDADRLTLSTNKQFISDLMPRHPIYVNLLAPSAQAVIGKPHTSTIPAMKILLREGFRYNGYVDIFDAGPTIEAPRDQIRTLSGSHVRIVQTIIDEVRSNRFILSNTQLDYRATISEVVCNDQDETCIISYETARTLQVKCGDSIRLSPLEIPK